MAKIWIVLLGLGVMVLGPHLAPSPAVAATLRAQWPAVADAANYEYEISISSKFEAESLVRQGRSQETRVAAEVPGGIFFLRTRPVLGDGDVGEWSAAQRVVVKSGGVTLQSPGRGEVLTLERGDEPVLFEWTGLEGAERYELQIWEIGGARKYRRALRSTAFPWSNLGAGRWNFRVDAMVGTERVAQSEVRAFNTARTDTPGLEILTPQEGDVLPAAQPILLSWSVPPALDGAAPVAPAAPVAAGAAQVELRSIDGTVFVNLDGGTADRMWLPALPPGIFALRLKVGALERVIRLRTEDDPLREKSVRLGLEWRILALAPVVVRAQANNYLLRRAGLESRGEGSGARFESRLRGFVSSDWGFEARLRSQSMGYSPHPTTLGYQAYDYDGPNAGGADLALLWRRHDSARARSAGAQGTGAQGEWVLKARLQYEFWQQLVPASVKNLEYSNFGLVRLGGGAEYNYRGWSRNWELESEVAASFPILHEAGPQLGSGAPSFYLPVIEADLILRRKLGGNWRGIVGLQMGAEWIRVNESRATVTDIAAGGAATTASQFWLGPRLGVEWLL